MFPIQKSHVSRFCFFISIVYCSTIVRSLFVANFARFTFELNISPENILNSVVVIDSAGSGFF